MAETKARITASVRPLAAPVDIAQADRNVAARDQLIEEFGGLTVRDLTTAVQPDDRIFSVFWQGVEQYPRFQFDEKGRPRKAVADVFTLLREVRSPWEIALWFTAANGWLDGDRPVDLLQTAPDSVVEAAGYEAQERVF